jgi:hypothetical protein
VLISVLSVPQVNYNKHMITYYYYLCYILHTKTIHLQYSTIESYTNGQKISRYHLLVLDGHGSHLTREFDRICKEHEVILVCMLAHSSHLL